MAISIRNASRAGASEDIDELRETIASLEAQVTSLYEEKEAGGLSTGGGDSDGLVALYEQKLALSQVTIRELESAVASFEAQLETLYADREAAGDASVGDLAESLASFEAQLASLYADRESTGDAATTIEGLNAQLAALYDEKAEQGDLPAIIEGLEAQLHALYREREDGDFAATLGGADAGALIATIRSFEEQLAGFYEAQAEHQYGLAEANAMVQSLEPQVATLLEERNELAEALHAKELELERSRAKAKDMVTALMERALA